MKRRLLPALALVVCALSGAAIYWLWNVVRAPLSVPPHLVQILASDPHESHYAGCAYEALPAGHLFRRLPRYLGVHLVAWGHRLNKGAYARQVALSMPFKVSEKPDVFGLGLENAARLLFQCPLDQLTEEQVATLMKYSVAPKRFPLANGPAK
ncbi:MAG: hypothetical protein V4662_02825 [Verrucomicrobiota bacterium]